MQGGDEAWKLRDQHRDSHNRVPGQVSRPLTILDTPLVETFLSHNTYNFWGILCMELYSAEVTAIPFALFIKKVIVQHMAVSFQV